MVAHGRLREVGLAQVTARFQSPCDGTRRARVSVQGETAEAAASRAAEALIEKGAEAILAEASRP